MQSSSIEAVVFDWAGTTVDHGSLAPVTAVIGAFRAQGVEVTQPEARGPMGMAKRDHFGVMIDDVSLAPRLAVSALAGLPREAALDALMGSFTQLQDELVLAASAPLDGVVAAVDELRRRGVRIASNTGYSSVLMAKLCEASGAHGYRPEVVVTPDQVSAARPYPYLSWRALELVGASSARVALKVDDTVVGVEEGCNAGMWSIGVARTGNEVGLSAAEWAATPVEEQESLLAAARTRLSDAGAHVVIDAVSDIVAVVDQIEGWLRAGRRP